MRESVLNIQRKLDFVKPSEVQYPEPIIVYETIKHGTIVLANHWDSPDWMVVEQRDTPEEFLLYEGHWLEAKQWFSIFIQGVELGES